MSDESNGKAEMRENFGCAAVILAFCLGIGGCQLMDQYGRARILEVEKAAADKRSQALDKIIADGLRHSQELQKELKP